jgi:hypothetical protein
MNVSEMKTSKFLKREEFKQPQLVTIAGDVFQENMARDDEPEKLKYCLRFAELEKPLALNVINQEIIGEIAGPETSLWDGVKVVLYDDPNVMYAGKRVGGIRVRAPRNQPKPSPVAAPAAPTHGAMGKPQGPRTAPAPVAEPSDNDGGNVEADDVGF